MHLLRRLLRGEDAPVRRVSPRAPRKPAHPPVPGARPARGGARARSPRGATRRSADTTSCGPSRADYLHVTLVFLGWQYERDVDRIAATAFEPLAGLPPATLGGARPGAGAHARPAPVRARPRRPGGAAAGRPGRRRRARSPTARFYEPEKRPFWPHVTLARVKRGRRAPRVDGAGPARRAVRGLDGDAVPLGAPAAGRPLRAAAPPHAVLITRYLRVFVPSGPQRSAPGRRSRVSGPAPAGRKSANAVPPLQLLRLRRALQPEALRALSAVPSAPATSRSTASCHRDDARPGAVGGARGRRP